MAPTFRMDVSRRCGRISLHVYRCRTEQNKLRHPSLHWPIDGKHGVAPACKGERGCDNDAHVVPPPSELPSPFRRREYWFERTIGAAEYLLGAPGVVADASFFSALCSTALSFLWPFLAPTRRGRGSQATYRSPRSSRDSDFSPRP